VPHRNPPSLKARRELTWFEYFPQQCSEPEARFAQLGERLSIGPLRVTPLEGNGPCAFQGALFSFYRRAFTNVDIAACERLLGYRCSVG